MKILFDSQIYYQQQVGGITRYFNELYSALKENGVEYQLCDKKENDNSLTSNFLIDKFKSIVGNPRLSEFESGVKYMTSCVQSFDYDIFHPTYYDLYFIENLKKPFVLTVHDMIHEIYPEYFMNYESMLKTKRILIQKASKIIAVSRNTKNDIIKYAGVNPAKIEIIYHKVPILGNEKIDVFESGRRYFLYVGQRGAYKNFYFMLIAMRALLLDYNDVDVFCVGKEFSESELRFIDDLHLGGRIKAFNVSDSQLGFLYRNTVALIFPSLYEGFGFPILEAFSCNCPVLASNSSCFPEIACDAALYFNPKSATEIVSCLYNVMNDRRLRADLIDNGRKRLRCFSNQQFAEKHIGVYENLL